MKKLFLILISTILAFDFAAAQVQNGKVDITSNKLEVEKEAEIAIFSGNVKAMYQDMNLESDKLRVEYDSDSKTKQKIKVIIATGNVILTQQNDKITADYAEYYINNNEIIFKNNVTLNRNGNILKGDILTVNTETKKAEIRSLGNNRVQGVYFNRPKEEDKSAN